MACNREVGARASQWWPGSGLGVNALMTCGCHILALFIRVHITEVRCLKHMLKQFCGRNFKETESIVGVQRSINAVRAHWHVVTDSQNSNRGISTLGHGVLAFSCHFSKSAAYKKQSVRDNVPIA